MSVRIQAADLRDAARKSAAIKADAAARGEAVPAVYLDVEVVIDQSTARAFSVADDHRSASVRYVGTPRGLAGLISDVRRLGIADGVVLLTPDKGWVEGLMLDELALGLATPIPA